MSSDQESRLSRPETTICDTSSASYEFKGSEEKLDSTEIQEVPQEVEAHNKLTDLDVPDGGLRAWLVVLAGHTSTFAAFGFINAWGVFQEYYEQNLLHGESPSTIAWIGSIQYALVFMPGLLVGRLFDRGYYRIPFAIGSAGLITSTFLIAECTKYWHFLLCQGVFVGLSAGIIIILGLGVLPQWFKAKRGVALGLITIGASFGGVVYPIAARKLIPIIGFKWTMRTLGFIHVFLLVIANTCTKRRLPPKKNQLPVSLRAFRNPPFAFFCAAGFMTFLGLYTVLTYISVSAREYDISDNFAFYYVAIVNAGGVLGRGVLGRLGDRFGPLSIIAPSTFVAGILTYTWPFVTSKGGLIALGLVYGIASGGFLALFGAPTVHMGDFHENGTRLGLFLTCMSLGALAGPPISGAIKDTTGSFTLVGVWAGTAIMVSVVLFTLSRYTLLRGWSGKA